MGKDEEEMTTIEKMKTQYQKSRRFIRGCDGPSKKEYRTLFFSTSTAMLVIGVAGFTVKLLSNNLFKRLLNLNAIDSE